MSINSNGTIETDSGKGKKQGGSGGPKMPELPIGTLLTSVCNIKCSCNFCDINYMVFFRLLCYFYWFLVWTNLLPRRMDSLNKNFFLYTVVNTNLIQANKLEGLSRIASRDRPS